MLSMPSEHLTHDLSTILVCFTNMNIKPRIEGSVAISSTILDLHMTIISLANSVTNPERSLISSFIYCTFGLSDAAARLYPTLTLPQW